MLLKRVRGSLEDVEPCLSPPQASTLDFEVVFSGHPDMQSGGEPDVGGL